MKNLIAILAVFFAGSLYAQDYTFKVLINKGQNSVRSGNEWLPIKVGASLRTADELRISSNGYLGLMHASGKPLEVKQAGEHKVGELASQVQTGTSVLNKYTDFILSSTAEKRTNLNATGAVTRGDKEINLYLPDARKSIILNDEVVIAWSKQKKSTTYVVLFSSMFGDELDRHEVTDTTLRVNLNDAKFANEDNIVVKVSSRKNSRIASEEFIIKKVSEGDRNRLRGELEEVSSLIAEKTALNQFYLANFYEQNMLIIDAATAYQNAIGMAPEVEDFRTAFEQFVVRNQLRK